MSNLIQYIEEAQLKHDVPEFRVGDTVVVQVEVREAVVKEAAKGKAKATAKEASRTRIQAYEGLVIAKRNRGLNSSFTVRKLSHGEGVERVFQTHSPVIKGIELKRRGHVRKAKLYYLRGRTGKSARIRERLLAREDVSAAP